MNNAFETLRSTLHKFVEKSRDREYPFLSTHKDDLDIYDKDIILNDAQKGDHYLSILKASGAGTYLMRITQDDDGIIEHRVKSSGKESVFHILSFTGINEATIKELSYDDALKCQENPRYKEPMNRVPRRIFFRDEICNMVGLPEGSMKSTLFASNFNPEAGDKTLLKISHQSATRAIQLDVCRTDSNNKRKIGKVETFFIESPILKDKLMGMIDGKTNHLLITHKDPRYAEFKTITERVYANAVKRAGVERSHQDEGMTM